MVFEVKRGQFGKATVTEHFFISRVAFIFREPEPNTPFLIFLRPLSSSVWICTLAFFLFVLAVLKVAMKIENTAGKPKNLDDSWSSVIVLSVGMFCQQGSAMVPTLFCGRITTFSMFFFSLLFIQFYSGSIISYLLRTQETGIKTVADILHSSLQVGCDDIIYNKDYFKVVHIAFVLKQMKSAFVAPEIKQSCRGSAVQKENGK